MAGGGRGTVTRIVVGVAAVALLLLAGRAAGRYVIDFAGWVDGLGVWGPVVFIAGYALATVAFVPGSLLTLAAGAIFGLGEGIAYVLVAATLGACAAFLVARYAARDRVERHLAGNPRFRAIDRAIGAEGRRIAVLLRLSPVVPFNLLNYALGLTNIRFADFALASIGMVPGTVLYVYYGSLVRNLAAIAGGVDADRDAGYYVVLGLGLVATIAVTTLVTRTARRALREATADDAGPGH